MLKILNVSKKFGSHIILKNINLNVEKSQIIGLAGPSGSGKSTLLRCIQKLETIDSGSIEYGGESGFMFQDFQLFPHMTVLQNLTYAPMLQDKTKDYAELAMEMLDQLSVADKADFYPHKLSGGQKQRVALARSLMMHPQILLCDEPTSGLDVATISEVVALLESIRNMGVTMLIASHDLDFLTKISNRIALLKGGEIVIEIEPKSDQNTINYLKTYY
jgi:polar amino acid transport system ATP-binding protein